MHDRSLAKKITHVPVCISIIWLIVYVNGGREVAWDLKKQRNVEFFREESFVIAFRYNFFVFVSNCDGARCDYLFLNKSLLGI